MFGTLQFFLQGPGQVAWTYSLPESAARSLSQGEVETLHYPIALQDGPDGQATATLTIHLVGTNEVPFLLPPGSVLTGDSNTGTYLLPPDLLVHQQTQSVSISEQPWVNGSPASESRSGTIAFIDPDRLDHPTVTLDTSVIAIEPNFHFQLNSAAYETQFAPLADAFHYTLDQHGNFGTLYWDYNVADSALDFLSDGMTATVRSILSITDGHGAPTMADIEVTLTGRNDGPLFDGAHTISFALDENQHGNQHLEGTFAFSDPDLFDFHEARVELQPVSLAPEPLGTFRVWVDTDTYDSGAGGVVRWSYDVDPSTWPGGTNHHEFFDVIVSDAFGGVDRRTIDIVYEPLTGL